MEAVTVNLKVVEAKNFSGKGSTADKRYVRVVLNVVDKQTGRSNDPNRPVWNKGFCWSVDPAESTRIVFALCGEGSSTLCSCLSGTADIGNCICALKGFVIGRIYDRWITLDNKSAVLHVLIQLTRGGDAVPFAGFDIDQQPEPEDLPKAGGVAPLKPGYWRDSRGVEAKLPGVKEWGEEVPGVPKKSVTAISFASGVTEIGMDAFSGCPDLRRVAIPSTVKII
jgi:hypothetical protein